MEMEMENGKWEMFNMNMLYTVHSTQCRCYVVLQIYNTKLLAFPIHDIITLLESI